MTKKILQNAIFSFMGPPMGWMLIIFLSQLMSIDELINVVLNPFFFLYCGIFLTLNIIRNKRYLKKIDKLVALNDEEKINKLLLKAPFQFYLFTFTYGILGPPAVTLGLGLDDHVFYTAWLLGPVVILTFSVPFFNHYMILLDKYVSTIQLHPTYYYSLKKRLNTSIAFLIVGVMAMLSIVFYVLFYNHLQGNTLTNSDLQLRLVFFGLLGAVIVIIPLLLQTKVMKTNLNQLNKYVEQLMEGNLGQQMEVTQRDELGLVMQAIQALSSKFNEVISQIKQDASIMNNLGLALKDAAHVIATGSQDQVDNSKETLNSVELLQEKIVANTSGSEQMEESSLTAFKEIESGINGVNDLVAAVDKVNMIVKHIDEIAKKTHLLAINASIEASNAGEHGKGFSVVAKEVKYLAEKSKERSEAIEKELTQVKTIVKQTKSIYDVVGPLSLATKETAIKVRESSAVQREEINKISEIIALLDKTIQDFDMNAKQINENSQTIESTAQKLKGISDYFTTQQ